MHLIDVLLVWCVCVCVWITNKWILEKKAFNITIDWRKKNSLNQTHNASYRTCIWATRHNFNWRIKYIAYENAVWTWVFIWVTHTATFSSDIVLAPSFRLSSSLLCVSLSSLKLAHYTKWLPSIDRRKKRDPFLPWMLFELCKNL